MIKYSFCIRQATHYTCKTGAYSYVKQKEIDEISADYGETKWQTVKKYGAIFKHIGIQGYKGFKSDLVLRNELARKLNLTKEQIKEKMRIKSDILKMGPLILIQILPFSGPLFMAYMYTYPGSIPSWFLIDYYHDRHQELKLRNQKKNIQYFKDKNLKADEIQLDKLSLRELRKISLLLFGMYKDGTIGYRRVFSSKISNFFSESFSKWLIKRYIQGRFKRDLLHKETIEKMSSLDQMVRWKYQRVMSGEDAIEFHPMYEKTEERIKVDEGKESKIIREIEQAQQLQGKKDIK